MKRKIISMFIVIALLFSLCATSFAAENADTVIPSIYFSGTTANCEVTISALGKYIDADLELWQGNTKVASWPGSGSNYVIISGTYGALHGREYTLKVTGTIGGVAIDVPDISYVCP